MSEHYFDVVFNRSYSIGFSPAPPVTPFHCVPGQRCSDADGMELVSPDGAGLSDLFPLYQSPAIAGVQFPGFHVRAIRIRGRILPHLLESIVPSSPANSNFNSPWFHRVMLVLDNEPENPNPFALVDPNPWFSRVFNGLDEDGWRAAPLAWFLLPQYSPRLRVLADFTLVSQPRHFHSVEVGTEPDFTYPSEAQAETVFFSKYVTFPKPLFVRVRESLVDVTLKDKALRLLFYSTFRGDSYAYNATVSLVAGLRVYY